MFIQNTNNNHLRTFQVTRYTRPYAHTNYLYSSFVPSVISV